MKYGVAKMKYGVAKIRALEQLFRVN